MSIYLVNLNKFHSLEKPEDAPEWYVKQQKDHRDIARSIVKYSKCEQCEKENMDFRYVWAYHALAWGYDPRVWCSKRCVNKYLKRG